MRIAAFIQTQLRARLERVVTSDDRLLRAESWADLITIVRQHRADIAVVDPFVRRHNDVHQVTRLASQFPDLPILVYTVVGPLAARSIIELSNASISHVCLHPFEGTPPDFREEMTSAIQDNLSAHFMKDVTESVEVLPINLRRAVQRMFVKPEQFKSAGDLALHAEVTPLQMYRYFEFAGLNSPKQLLVTARLLRFYAHTRYAGMTAQTAAKRLGYSDCRVLSRYSQKSLGVSLAKLRGVAESRLFTELVKMVVKA